MSHNMKGGPVFLTTAEVAERWAMSPRSLEGWRDKGIGVVWHRLNGGAVRYHIDDVEEFERRGRLGGQA